MNTSKAQKRKQFALLISSTIFTLILAEFVLGPVVCRAKSGLSRRMTLMGFVATPGEVVSDTTINAQGYTGHLLSDRGKPENSLRILTLGGSAMFNRTMTERLIEAVSAVHRGPLEIQGAALRSHTSRSSLIKFREHFSRYQFDYVFIYHGINDLFADQCPQDRFREDYSQINGWYRRNSLLNNSVIARFLYNHVIHKQQHRFSPRVYKEAGAFKSIPTFESNIRELVREIEKTHAQAVLMTFAWHIPGDYTREKFLNHELDYVNPTHYNECAVDLWGSTEYVREALARNNAALMRIAAEAKLPLLDQDARFSHRSELFGDVCHFNEPGADRFVGSIVDFLVKDGAFDTPR